MVTNSLKASLLNKMDIPLLLPDPQSSVTLVLSKDWFFSFLFNSLRFLLPENKSQLIYNMSTKIIFNITQIHYFTEEKTGAQRRKEVFVVFLVTVTELGLKLFWILHQCSFHSSLWFLTLVKVLPFRQSVDSGESSSETVSSFAANFSNLCCSSHRCNWDVRWDALPA